MPKPKIAVALTAEGQLLLRDASIEVFLKDGVFNCDSIKDEGYFLLMKINWKFQGPNEKVVEILCEVSIPKQFVLYTISAHGESDLGFLQNARR